MLYNKKISVIIPCKNEEVALYSILSKLPKYVDEVIVVDNNSTDNTAKVAKSYGAKVVHEKRTDGGVGYGFAHLSGIKAAKGDILIALDGDDTYPISEIKNIVSYMQKSNADFVTCARFPLAFPKAISRTRQLGVQLLNLQVSLLYGKRIRDILSGMWAIDKNCIKKLDLQEGGWNFSPEIKLAAMTHPDIHFSEYHIPHTLRLFGSSKQNIWATGIDHLLYIIKRRFTRDRVYSRQIRLGLQAIPQLARK